MFKKGRPKLLGPPSPVSITDTDIEEYINIVVDRAVNLTVILLESIKELVPVARGKTQKVGQLTGSAAQGATKASKLVPFSSILVAPFSELATYVSKNANRKKAVKSLWLLENSPSNSENLRSQIIRSAVELFISFEVPCNTVGKQYMDILAMDATHRILDFLQTNYKKTELAFDPDLILKGVLQGRSKLDGYLSRARSKPGYDLGDFNTQEIFEKPGRFYRNQIFSNPKNEAYGFRLKFQFESETAVIGKIDEIDTTRLPRIREWNAEAEELILRICKRAKDLVAGDYDCIVEKIDEKLQPYFLKLEAKLDLNHAELISKLGFIEMDFELLKLSSSSEPTSTTEYVGCSDSASIWFEVPVPVVSFTGREKELTQLHESLSSEGSTVTVINQIATITGLGGIGKSELAKTYAHTYYDFYNGNVLWIHAETQPTFRNSLCTLLQEHFKKKDDECKRLTEIDLLKIVYQQFIKTKCLIIFDNVEDLDVVNLLPKSGSPKNQVPNILITSRKKVWKTGIKVISLDVWSSHEAVAFVNKCIKTDDDVLPLVRALQCLPLALQQAVAYIRAELGESPSPIRKYLELFEAQKKNLLNYKNQELSGHEQTTYKTWTITMQKIESNQFGPLSMRIMKIISWFEPENIPSSVYLDLDQMSGSPINRDEVDSAISLLKLYSMVSGPPGIINIHRLVQRVIRLNTEHKVEASLNDGLELLVKYMDPATKNDAFVKSLLPHAESICRHSMKYTELARRFTRFPSDICEKLRYHGRYSAMLQLAQDCKSNIEAVWGPSHEHTFRIILREAEAFFYLHRRSESLIRLNKLLPTAKEALGCQHLMTTDILSLIANNLSRKGMHQEDLKIREEILATHIPKLGPEHKETLAELHNKAHALFNLGRLNESLELFQRVLEVRKRLFPEDDSETLITMNLIATVFGKQEKWEEALALVNSVWKIQRNSLGEDHPDTFGTLHTKAQALWKLGKHSESVEIFRRIYEVQKRALARDESDYASTHWTDVIPLEQGNREAALEIYNEIYETQIQLLGPDHPDTLTMLHNKAMAVGNFGRLDESLELFRIAYAARKRVYGEENPKTRETMSELAKVLAEIGKWDEALSIFDSIIAQLPKASLITLHNKAVALFKLGRYTEALELFKRIYEAKKREVDEDAAVTLAALSWISRVLLEQGKYEEALSTYDTIYEAHKRVLGAEHPEALSALHDKAFALKCLGRLNESLELFQKVHEVGKTVAAVSNSTLMLTMIEIGSILHSQGKWEEVLEVYNEMYETEMLSVGLKHSDTLVTLHNKATALMNLGRLDESLELMQQVYEIGRTVWGKDDANALATKAEIEKIQRVLGK